MILSRWKATGTAALRPRPAALYQGSGHSPWRIGTCWGFEDIIDTGRTIGCLRKLLWAQSPRSVALCALLDKAERREDRDLRRIFRVV